MLQRGLGRNENSADIDVDDAIQLFERSVFELFRDGCAGIVHQHIEPTKGGNGLLDRGIDSCGVGGIRLDRDSLAAGALDGFDYCGSCSGVLRVGDGNARSVAREALRNRRANSSGTAGNERYFVG